MLKQLHIEHVAVIDSADVSMASGFHVLTGETGAGKSLIVESVNMVTGERTSRDIIPSGEKKALVEALFEVTDGEVKEKLEALGFPIEDDSVLLCRELYADGRNVCRINGHMATVAMLRQVGHLLIDIHGQQDGQALLHKENHLSYLDAFSPDELKALLTQYKEKYAEWVEIRKKLRMMMEDDSDKEQRAELLRFQIDELEQYEPWSIDEDALKNERSVLQNAGKIKQALREVVSALSDGDGFSSAEDLLSGICRTLRNASGMDAGIEQFMEEATDIECRLQDLSASVSRYEDSVSLDEERLDIISETLDSLVKLKRKYGNTPQEMEAYYRQAMEELSNIDFSAEKLAEYQKESAKLETELHTLADDITIIRKNSAKKLEEAVTKELLDLNMPKVVFEVSLQPSQLTESGQDDVEFLISTVPTEPTKPMTKIASGGEMARIMLAMKTVLSDEDFVETLVFDEIDTGVSGRAATRIAEKMKELSKTKQVLCITHLPQIAAVADSHFLVLKDANSFHTSVSLLSEEERLDELARLMGGDVPSETIREGARELRRQYL